MYMKKGFTYFSPPFMYFSLRFMPGAVEIHKLKRKTHEWRREICKSNLGSCFIWRHEGSAHLFFPSSKTEA